MRKNVKIQEHTKKASSKEPESDPNYMNRESNCYMLKLFDQIYFLTFIIDLLPFPSPNFDEFLFIFDVIGLEATITDYKGNAVTLKNAKIVVESEDENKIQVRLPM